MNHSLHPQTLAITSSRLQDQQSHAVSTPLYMSTTFERNADGSYPGDYIYTRMGNPNRALAEQSIAALEGGDIGIAFSSGMAAISAIFQTLKPGDHVLLPDDVYYTVNHLARSLMGKWGLEVEQVDMSDLFQVQAAAKENTKLIWLETPSNPQLKISDIVAIAEIAHDRGAICAVDNTWPSPVLQRPLRLGADIVMHSTTKYFGGHSDVLGGCLVLNESRVGEQLREIQLLGGAVPSPMDCWLITRGIKTLYLRVMAQSKSAMQLAEFLAEHPAIEAVHYPGLTSHPQHAIAASQMIGGFGGMLSVQVKGDAQKAMHLTERLSLFTIATSLGGVESLIEHRKSVEGPESPTPDNLLRLSVGLEHIEDLIRDWEMALG